MTDKIQKAAEIIQHEVRKNVGAHIHQEDAERLARELHKLWSERVEIAQLPPGEVAQRMRERYEFMTNPDIAKSLYEAWKRSYPEIVQAWGEINDRMVQSQQEGELPATSRASHYS